MSRPPTKRHNTSRRIRPAQISSLSPSPITATPSTSPTTTRPLPAPRTSVSPFTSTGPTSTKNQRTSKTSQKLVLLPSAPQTKPLPSNALEHVVGEYSNRSPRRSEEEEEHGYQTDGGKRERKSEAERMTRDQRERAGYKRITAYCVAETFKMKALTAFLKREHGVMPRVFDEAVYAMYHLPLLPGYGPNTNIRSSLPPPVTHHTGKSFLTRLSEAEENGYQGTYFSTPTSHSPKDGYITSGSPLDTRDGALRRRREGERQGAKTPESENDDGYYASEAEPVSSPTKVEDFPQHIVRLNDSESEAEAITTNSEAEPAVKQPENEPVVSSSHSEAETAEQPKSGTHTPLPANRSFLNPSPVLPSSRLLRFQSNQNQNHKAQQQRSFDDDKVAEVIYFEYGVVVFFGLDEGQEKGILEDVEAVGGIMMRKFEEGDWEIEQCHYAHDPYIAYPRIYNDFFTLKSPSHLLKLSIAHALAQSTLLAHYESLSSRILSSPQTLSIPLSLAKTGSLSLRRHEALKLTGKLFKLRRDVNLVSNVLDVPELFWSEASLGELYGAVREYMEISGRVGGLNEKLGVASDFLDAIHDHLNNNAMHRITWTVIWLIVVAILVELGEVIARLVIHSPEKAALKALGKLSREQMVSVLEKVGM